MEAIVIFFHPFNEHNWLSISVLKPVIYTHLDDVHLIHKSQA